MSALLKVYTDSGHTTEVAHTTISSTTIETGHAASAGDTVLYVTALPAAAQGWLDIVDGTNGNETIAYYGATGNTVNIANTGGLAHLHPAGTTVNFWYYQLAVGDQTNGIPNDGTNATPDANNTAAFYAYNAGDQTAQSVSIAVNTSDAADTTAGKTDTLVSITSATSGFASSVTPANITSGSQQEFWVVAEIPNGQSAAGNPQICAVNITYQSI
jgi:hypothetical protein